MKKDKLFEDVKPEHYFFVCDGTVVKNLLDLVDALEYMDDYTFRYHVNEHKNDFYNWIKDVFQEEELAARILPVKDKREIQVAILREMVRRLLKNKKTNKKKAIKKNKKDKKKVV